MEENYNQTFNNVGALEISSNHVKFAIGSFIDKKPVLCYFGQESIRGAVKDGVIVDPSTVKSAIANVLAKTDETLKLKVDVGSISLVLPPFGLTVYQSNQQTNVVSEADLIDQLDITNAMRLVQKETVPQGTSIVDIVPDYYQIDNQKRFWNAPIGEKSKNLLICAKIHTLPDSLIRNYRMPIEESGLKIERIAVAPFASCSLIATSKNMPHDYLLVDMGAHFTSVSMVGANCLFASLSFAKGGDDLTETIASSFSLSFEEAENLKIDYGFHENEGKFSEPLANSLGEDNQKHDYFQTDLNHAISTYFSHTYNVLLSNAINSLLEKSLTPLNKDFLPSLPIVFVGGASELYGLSKLISPAIGNHKAIFYRPTVLGAREAKYSTLLGLIAAQGDNRGRVDSLYRISARLSRTKN